MGHTCVINVRLRARLNLCGVSHKMTIIKGYKQKQELPNICYCEYCGNRYGNIERDIKALYKQVGNDIFTVAVCYDCMQMLKQRGELVGIRDKSTPEPYNIVAYEFREFRIKLG